MIVKFLKKLVMMKKKCPYCNSLNIKEYLYGEPSYDYDREKYVLGGCEVSYDNPKYKCSDCGKDIYIKHVVESSDIVVPDLTINDNKEYINIIYSDKDYNCDIRLTKSKIDHAGIEDYISSICLKKTEYKDNKTYKFDDVTEWSLVINTKDDQLSFSDVKVPSNIDELKNITIELEELYESELKKRKEQIDNMFN